MNGSKMKLLIISQYFYPYSETSTPKVLTELAEDLVESGMEIQVLTTKLSYNSKEIKSAPNKEIYKGIKINRIWCTNGNKNNPAWRILNYVSFIIGTFKFLLLTKEYDTMLFVSNPPIAPYIGHLIKKIKKKKYIYLVHDFYPDIAIKLNVIKENSIIAKLMKYVNKKVFESSDKIIVLGEDMKRVMLEKGVIEEKISIVTNWADANNIYKINKTNKFSTTYELDNSFNIIYTGNIGRFHDVETIVKCAIELKNEKDIKFIIIGEGYKKKLLQNMKAENQLDNLMILGYQDDKTYNEVLNTASIFVSSLEDGVEGLAVPSKTYSYFASGKPVVAIMGEKSEIGMVVKRYNLGLVLKHGDSQTFKKYILQMRNNPREYDEICKNVLNVFNNNYERKIVTKQFENEILLLNNYI